MSETSSQPVVRSASQAASTTSSTGRSRTGRYHMPAWQNRQPAVQPRMTSTTARSWTASSTGTTGSVTGIVCEKPMKTWRRARRSGAAGSHTPGTAASSCRRAARDEAPKAATIASRRPSTSPTNTASRKGESGHGLALPGPPPKTMGSPSPRSPACRGTPARSSSSSTFV